MFRRGDRDLSEVRTDLVRTLWQYCNVLRDDGLSYPDYVEQLTYLLFLKLSSEQHLGPVPKEFGWESLVDLDATDMHEQYGDILYRLGAYDGMLGAIFRNARNKIRDPAKLRLLVRELIGRTEWSGLSADVKGDAYEGLLEKNARDTKSGAGQYFTPRPLIDAIVECIEPRPNEMILDPACGTGGFLVSAWEFVRRGQRLSNATRRRVGASVRGVELVEEVARLATMNLLLHGITEESGSGLPISCEDSLRQSCPMQVDVVMTNPPFGIKGSVTYGREQRSGRKSDELSIARPDFWVETANKQLNFVQHVYALLKPGGRAAVVVPDNVLFERGAAEVVRRQLLKTCNVHMLLRLPAGLFYAQGVKANVLFFDRLKGERRAEEEGGSIGVYDLRTDNRFSLKTNPLRRSDLTDFVDSYRLGRRNGRDSRSSRGSERLQEFDVRSILESETCNLDITWGHAEANKEALGWSRLDELSREISEELGKALEHVTKASRRLW